MDKIHTDLVDADAIVEGHQYETYYQVCDRQEQLLEQAFASNQEQQHGH
jgi:hypothetical protein